MGETTTEFLREAARFVADAQKDQNAGIFLIPNATRAIDALTRAIRTALLNADG